jgi:hypothetical protein
MTKLSRNEPEPAPLKHLTGPPYATETHAYREQKQTEVCL